MKEELLHKIKSEFSQQKDMFDKHDSKIIGINELLEVSKLEECISFNNQAKENKKQINLSIEDIILKIYYKYLHMIQADETNSIFVYLGTYQYNYDIDVVHSSNDIRVEYNSNNACYREFQDIEQPFPICVPIDKCEEFENKHNVIYTKSFFSLKKYYEIQKDFVLALINENQKLVKTYILRKYNS